MRKALKSLGFGAFSFCLSTHFPTHFHYLFEGRSCGILRKLTIFGAVIVAAQIDVALKLM